MYQITIVTVFNHSINMLLSSKHKMKSDSANLCTRSTKTQSFSNSLRICDFKRTGILMNGVRKLMKDIFRWPSFDEHSHKFTLR